MITTSLFIVFTAVDKDGRITSVIIAPYSNHKILSSIKGVVNMCADEDKEKVAPFVGGGPWLHHSFSRLTRFSFVGQITFGLKR